MLDFLTTLGICEGAALGTNLAVSAVDLFSDDGKTRRVGANDDSKIITEAIICGTLWNLLVNDAYVRDFNGLIKVFEDFKKVGVPKKKLDEWFDFIEGYVDLKDHNNRLLEQNRELKNKLNKFEKEFGNEKIS